MTVLIQISDPHFGTEQPEVVEALQRLARRLKPDILILSGDITQRARRMQFRAAQEFVASLGIPNRLILPGNHDIPLFNVAARLLHPYRNYQQSFGAQLEPQIEVAGIRIIGVNATRWWRHTDGQLGRAQIERVSRLLRDTRADQVKMVVTHQPLHVPSAAEKHDLAYGADAAIPAWSKAGADIVMGGHIHLPYVRPVHEYRLDLSRKLWCVQAGTAVSSRVRRGAPNSVHVLHVPDRAAESGLEVHRWDYDAEQGEFRTEQKDRLSFGLR